MNEQTHKNGQHSLLLKNFTQISISLRLKAKRVPFIEHRGRAVSSMKFKKLIQLIFSYMSINNSPKLTRTQTKSQSQIDIKINSHRKM